MAAAADVEIVETSHIQLSEQYGLTVDELSDLVSHRLKDKLAEYGGVEGVAARVRTNTRTGLTDAEADTNFAERRAYFGVNRYPEPPKNSFFGLWLEAMKDLTMIILMIAAVISIIIGAAIPSNIGAEHSCFVTSSTAEEEDKSADWIEGLMILVAVALVSTVTAGNNYSKELKFRALAAKEKDVPVKVKREGRLLTISIFEVNVGDIVLVDTGDQIPADGLFIQGYDLRVDESQMTGEPVPVKKSAEDPFMLSGTKITDGSGQFFATSVGPNSEWGKTIASLGDKPRPTPLQENLDEMAALIGKFGMTVAGIVFVVLALWWLIPAATAEKHWECRPSASEDYDPCVIYSDASTNSLCELYGYNWKGAVVLVQYFIVAVTIIVVAVPEGLPLAVTISLAYSMKQMYRDNNLVRHLKACETMSNCTNICSDKTGTLTENQMTVVKGWVASETFEALPLQRLPDSHVMAVLADGIAVNSNQTSNFYREEGKPINTVGNKTECALLMFLEALGSNYQEFRAAAAEKVYQRFTFSSARKRMSTFVWLDRDKGTIRMHCKGAPEVLIRRSLYYLDREGKVQPLDEAMRDTLIKLLATWASQGLRTLGLAYRDLQAPKSAEPVTPVTLGVEGIPVIRPASQPAEAGTSAEAAPAAEPAEEAAEGPIAVESDPTDNLFKFVESPDSAMIMVALVGIQDPVRKEVPQAVADCQSAGITVRMVTGDNIVTAKSIARECHILTDDGVAIEGPAFAKLTDEQLDQILPHLQVIARCAPGDKQRLVRRLIEKGEVVAVTGDGTNDVPALKEADVGLAMGIRGTDIAKQASDIVILDDNFQSIVRSVMWGRNVYDNIRKFLQFQLTVNVAALAVVFIGAVSQRGAPLKAIQLLWVNLIMDTLAALALGTERPTRALLQRKPFGRYDRLISPYMARAILVQSTFQIAVLLVLLYAGKHIPWLNVPCAYAQENTIFEPSPCLIEGVPATNAQIKAQTVALETIIFNTFVYCQVFNEINSRKVNGEWNVWENFFKNWMFPAIVGVISFVQALLVIFPGNFMQVTPFPGINWAQWLTCLVIAAFTLPLGLLANFIPVPKPKPKKLKSDEESGGCFGLFKKDKKKKLLASDADTVDAKDAEQV